MNLKRIIKNLIPLWIRVKILNYIVQKKYDVKFINGGASGRNTVFEGKNVLNNSKVYSSYVGLGTYISGNTKLNNAKIGRFCSIGQNVKNNFGRHPSNTFVSTHPAFFSIKKQAGFTFVKEDLFEEHLYIDEEKKYVNLIGNDVWIGSNVTIMEGITIGDGAIIATGAVVTKDIEPYTIVGGVPAKLIRKRFTEKEINFLLHYKWWEKDIKWLNHNSKYLKSIMIFLNKTGNIVNKTP